MFFGKNHNKYNIFYTQLNLAIVFKKNLLPKSVFESLNSICGQNFQIHKIKDGRFDQKKLKNLIPCRFEFATQETPRKPVSKNFKLTEWYVPGRVNA